MLTVEKSIRSQVKGLNSGSDDYILKPFQPEELLARVKAVLNRTYGIKK
jgi:DNA-binding response OmpR family regulator